MKPLEWFKQADFRKVIWLAPLAWALHEAEEWDIDRFSREHFADPGYNCLVEKDVLWLGLAWVAFIGVAWTALTAWPKNSKFAAFLTLPLFVYLSFGNVLDHILWVVRFGSYTPGAATAILLVGPVVVALTLKAIREKLVPWWYAAIFYLLYVPNLLNTLEAARKSPPEVSTRMQNLQRNSILQARSILGKPVKDCASGP